MEKANLFSHFLVNYRVFSLSFVFSKVNQWKSLSELQLLLLPQAMAEPPVANRCSVGAGLFVL